MRKDQQKLRAKLRQGRYNNEHADLHSLVEKNNLRNGVLLHSEHPFQGIHLRLPKSLRITQTEELIHEASKYENPILGDIAGKWTPSH
jgi:hypothetical protein